MKIGSVMDETNNSPWEVYENYKKSLNNRFSKTGYSKEETPSGECQACENRKYTDGSNDPGVSFKTPTRITPSQAASAVRGHEMEHVVRNQAEAQREDRKVVAQSVTYHNAICAECGSVYMSGGTTRTVTKGTSQPEQSIAPESKPGFDQYA